jgi:hypothetical protein
MDKLEERVGPKGRKWFEQFLRKVNTRIGRPPRPVDPPRPSCARWCWRWLLPSLPARIIDSTISPSIRPRVRACPLSVDYAARLIRRSFLAQLKFGAPVRRPPSRVRAPEGPRASPMLPLTLGGKHVARKMPIYSRHFAHAEQAVLLDSAIVTHSSAYFR